MNKNTNHYSTIQQKRATENLKKNKAKKPRTHRPAKTRHSKDTHLMISVETAFLRGFLVESEIPMWRNNTFLGQK